MSLYALGLYNLTVSVKDVCTRKWVCYLKTQRDRDRDTPWHMHLVSTRWRLVPAAARGRRSTTIRLINLKKKMKQNTKSHGCWRAANQRPVVGGRKPEGGTNGSQRSPNTGWPSLAIKAPAASRVLSRGTDHGCRRSSWMVFAPGHTGRAAGSSLRVVACPART